MSERQRSEKVTGERMRKHKRTVEGALTCFLFCKLQIQSTWMLMRSRCYIFVSLMRVKILPVSHAMFLR